PGGHLERADVASLAADDQALRVVVRQLHRRDEAVHEVRGRQPLDRLGDDAPRPPPRLGQRLVLDAADEAGRLLPRLSLELPDELAVGVARAGAGDPLQTLPPLQDERLRLLLERSGALLALLQRRLALVDLLLFPPQELELPGHVELLLSQTLLGALQLLALLAGLAREPALRRRALFLDLQLGLLEARVGPALRVADDPRGAPLRLRAPAIAQQAQSQRRGGGRERSSQS